MTSTPLTAARKPAVRVEMWARLDDPTCLGQAVVGGIDAARRWAQVTLAGWAIDDVLLGEVWVTAKKGTVAEPYWHRRHPWVPDADRQAWWSVLSDVDHEFGPWLPVSQEHAPCG